MSVLEIRALIDRAISIEKKHKYFLTFLEQNPRELHSSIQTSTIDKPFKLVSFVMTYTRHAPELIQRTVDNSKHYGFETYVDPVISLIIALFDTDNSDIKDDDQLLIVVSSAYLTYRFVEELNDWLYGEFGKKLITSDFTDANLLIYAILGDTYAYRLEQMITQVCEGFNAERDQVADELIKKFHQLSN